MATPKPLFVFGCYRSGTSLLRLILNSHPCITIPEETVYIPIMAKRLGQYNDLKTRADVERLVQDILLRLKKKTRWIKTPSTEEVMSLVPGRANYADIVRSIAMASGEKKTGLMYWGDKTPRYINSVLFLDELFPDARFINLVRDARDVAASVGSELLGWGRTKLRIAEEWNQTVFNALLAERMIGPERFLTIRYEDMVTHPEATIRKVSDFLAIAYDPDMLDFHKTPSARDLTRYERHRNVERPISPKSVGRYKKALTEKQIADIESEAGNALLYLGYPVEKSALSARQPVEKLLDRAKGVLMELAYQAASKANYILFNKK